MRDSRPVWVWSSATQLPPHQLRVYPGRALAGGVAVGLFVFLLVFPILAKLPPDAFQAPAGGIALAVLKLMAWKASGGFLFSVQGPAALQLATSGAVIGKSALAALIAAYIAWQVARSSMKPTDGYEHIRGTRLYRGARAEQVLRRQLSGEES